MWSERPPAWPVGGVAGVNACDGSRDQFCGSLADGFGFACLRARTIKVNSVSFRD
jgi:hypothetical protein